MVILYWRSWWSPERGSECSDWKSQDAGGWRTGPARLHRPRIGFRDERTVDGRAGHWWRTWATWGPASPTPLSPPGWGSLVCSCSQWRSFLEVAELGTWLSWSEELKMVVKTGASWSAQCFRLEDDTASGPAALRLFCFPKSRFTSRSSTMKGGGRAAWPVGEAVTGVEFRRSNRA